jgi:uncharacterized protein YdeI (YjbR/CyaY-like superfamily)
LEALTDYQSNCDLRRLRREYAEWIAGAKKEETRDRRLARAVEMLRESVKQP